MLFWLDFQHGQCNQTSENDSKYSSTSCFQWAKESPCYTESHLSALASSHDYQVQVTYRRAMGSAPPYLRSLLCVYFPSRSLRLVNMRQLMHCWEAQNHSPGRLVSPYPVGGMTYQTPSGQPNPSQTSRNNWKLISSMSTTQFHSQLVTYWSLFRTILASLFDAQGTL